MGPPGPGGRKETEEEKKAKAERRRRRFEPKPASRIGKKKRKRGPAQATKLPKGKLVLCMVYFYVYMHVICCKCMPDSCFPPVYPTAKCKLRQMKLERIKDFLLMEAEFIRNQQVLRPQVCVGRVCGGGGGGGGCVAPSWQMPALTQLAATRSPRFTGGP